jgi:hypothetical protein
LDSGYILAFEKAPASLRTLIIEHDTETEYDVLGAVFAQIGSRILTLRMENDQIWAQQLASIFIKFPNLLHLSVRSCVDSVPGIGHIDLETDHPLRSVTIILEEMHEIFDPEFVKCLKNLLHEDRLPNISSLRLSVDWGSIRRWAYLLRSYRLRGCGLSTDLLDIIKCLKRRNFSASDPKEGEVWLVNNGDSDSVICVFTEENFAKLNGDVPK